MIPPPPVLSPNAELRRLSAEAMRMGGLAEAQVVEAVQAVVRRDVPLAQGVIVRDVRLDELQSEIEARALDLIARHSWDEAELRRAVSTFKLATNLERCGDLARNIARRSLVLAASDPGLPLMPALERLGRLVSAYLRDVLNAYATADLELALGVWRGDSEIDERHEALSRDILRLMCGDPAAVENGVHLLFIGKNLERIGDHATNIAEVVYFQVTGEALSGERPKRSLPEADRSMEGSP